MSAFSRGALNLRATGRAARTCPSLFHYGRSPAYRRISGLHGGETLQSTPSIRRRNNLPPAFLYTATLGSPFLPRTLAVLVSARRHFQVRLRLSQDSRAGEEIKDPLREESKSSSGESRGQSQERPSTKEEDQRRQENGDNGSKQQERQEQRQEKEQQEQAPPPPHGNKSPWQVFTDTLRSEFKASKEWNESTKALASSAQDFTQNETLKRVRAGYDAASGAATSSTSRALKGTGSAIGRSAAWTWDTIPVKGVRKGFNATGRGVEKMTRPLRETEAYKSMSDVIDDGSSSRYGGWTDKEERRRKRETRELREAAQTGRPRRAEKVGEDPR